MGKREISYKEFLSTRKYTLDEIYESALIIHPKSIDKYGIEGNLIQCLFEEGSNFTRLSKPIIDEFDNHYRDSEGYYMAQRINNHAIKSEIALASQIPNNSKKKKHIDIRIN